MPEEKSRPPSASELSAAAEPNARPKRSRRGCFWVLALILLVPLLVYLGYWAFSRLAVGAAARLDELSGLVHVQRKDELDWNPAQLNQLLWGKDWIRTGAGSSARLRFFDVSTADVGSSTKVMVERVARKRGGDSGSVSLKMWSGDLAVRAVRFVDPGSIFRVDTPTASTVVRGARFTVGIEPDGGTRVEVQQGSAEVRVEGESHSVGMGEELTVGAGGKVERRRVFEPDAAPLQNRIEDAWAVPGADYQVELPEDELNQFLAAVVGSQEGLPVRDPQIWLAGNQALLSATVIEPIELDASVVLEIQVVEGKLALRIKVGAGGLPLPVPGPVLDMAMQTVLGQVQGYLDQAHEYVEFSEVQIKDGRVVAVGHKVTP